MRSRTVFLIILFLGQLCTVSAQQRTADDRILFRGVIQSATSGERLAGSKVYINRSLTVMSQDDGTFSFFASHRDTIVFDMMGYKASRLIVADSLKAPEFLTGIYLQNDSLDIGEVVIIPNLAGLRGEILNPSRPPDPKMENAVTNLNISSYQGRVSQSKMSDPFSNYEVLRQQQKISAFEKGGLPSSRIAGLNPFILIPAAYMLLHGLPDAPSAPKQGLSQKELNDLNRGYLERVKAKKGNK
jgi:hypothetical protein